MENQLADFWSLYDQYITNGDESLRSSLSNLLMQIEQKDRKNQLLRPEKGWDKILAWQVLRNQEFIFSDNVPFRLEEGEVLAWTPHWDRDVFLTRLPSKETISGKILKPGFKLTEEDKGEQTDFEWEQTIRFYGLTNEQGLYLPIYTLDTLMKLCDQQIAKIRPRIISYLEKEKGFNPAVLQNI